MYKHWCITAEPFTIPSLFQIPKSQIQFTTLCSPILPKRSLGSRKGGSDNSVFQRNRNRSGRRKAHSPPGELLSQLIGLSDLLLDTLSCSNYEWWAEITLTWCLKPLPFLSTLLLHTVLTNCFCLGWGHLVPVLSKSRWLKCFNIMT